MSLRQRYLDSLLSAEPETLAQPAPQQAAGRSWRRRYLMSLLDMRAVAGSSPSAAPAPIPEVAGEGQAPGPPRQRLLAHATAARRRAHVVRRRRQTAVLAAGFAVAASLVVGTLVLQGNGPQPIVGEPYPMPTATSTQADGGTTGAPAPTYPAPTGATDGTTTGPSGVLESPSPTPTSAPGPVTGWSAGWQNCGSGCYTVLAKWHAVPGAITYLIHYTNDGKGRADDTMDNDIQVDSSTLPDGAPSYTIPGPMSSGDRICLRIRASNAFGLSPWSQSICGTVPR